MTPHHSTQSERIPLYNKRYSLQAVQQDKLAAPDTIKLTLQEFDVSKDAQLSILPHVTDMSGATEERAPLFQDSSGREHVGQKAYLNSDNYQLTIKNGYCFVQFNANKLSHYYQLDTDRQHREAQILAMTHDIEQAGISADWSSAKLSRLDICKQKQLSHSLMTYHTVFAALSAKRQLSKVHGDTFLFMNKSRGTQFYDKSVESEIPDMSNLIRAELQLKNARAVQSHTPLCTLSDLLAMETEEITSVYNRQLQDTLFSKTSDSDVAEDIQLLSILQQQYPRYFIDKYLQLIGIPELVRKFGSIDAFADVLETLGAERTTVWRRKKKIAQHYKEYQLLRERVEKSNKKLFTEIYSFAA